MEVVNSSSTASLGARSREELKGAAAVCLGCLSLRWRQPCVWGGEDREGVGECHLGPCSWLWDWGVCAWDRFSIVLVMPQSLGIENLVLPK